MGKIVEEARCLLPLSTLFAGTDRSVEALAVAVVGLVVVGKILTSFWNTFGKKVFETSGKVVVPTCFAIPNQREQKWRMRKRQRNYNHL